jgi:lysophospholipase L1-like esterase
VRALFLRSIAAAFTFVAPVAWTGPLMAEESALQPKARVAIVGDSITEQKLYSKYVESWLLACSGVPDLRVMQFGWGGETAGGFANRADNDLAVFDPDIVTLCYGMNDGGYQPWRSEIGTAYEANMRRILDRLSALGVKSVVVGSPGAVDTNFFRPGQTMADKPAHIAYNDNLAHLRDIDRALATEKGQRFADVHAAMVDAMTKANGTLGPKYDVCGGDGFHPGPNGQLLMAYAFLKGLGVDGSIGEITVDLSAGTAKGTPGQKVAGVKKDGVVATVEVSSTRWPFCFEGEASSSGGTRSILPFVPFNDDLNRYRLKVTGLQTPAAKVTWGSETKTFTKDQLAAGVNLAAEFPHTPFDEPFAHFQAAVAEKQNFETFMIKQIVTDFRLIPDISTDVEAQAAAKVISGKLMKRWEALDQTARERLVPVIFTIRIEPTAG